MMQVNKLAANAACLLIGLALPAQASDAWLSSRLNAAIKAGRYVAVNAQDMARAEQLFGRIARGTSAAEVRAQADELAMEIEENGSFLVLRERDDARRGRGFYAFRRAALQDVLHIPHGFKDEMTRDIGLDLFTEGRFAAAAWNTVPRHYDEAGSRIDADVAHLPASWFTAFARASAQAWPQGNSLQIHGFDANKRKSSNGADAELIMANGTGQPPAVLASQRDCLAKQLKRRVSLYPVDVRELGGTTNVQGAHLRLLGYGGFVHLEIGRALRLDLHANAATRASFLSCLQR